jgi:hypothetical protein
VDDLGAALLGFHHPLKTDGMIFGHVGAFNQNAIGIRQILLKRGGATPPEAGPQTGDRGGVSNTGLIFDLYDAEPAE